MYGSEGLRAGAAGGAVAVSDADPAYRRNAATGERLDGQHLVRQASHGDALVARGTLCAVGAGGTAGKEPGLVPGGTADGAGPGKAAGTDGRAVGQDGGIRRAGKSRRKSVHYLEPAAPNR